MASSPNNVLELEQFLPYRISILANRVSSVIANAYASKFGLTITEWRIMAILGRYPGVSAEQICQRTQMEKSIVSRAIARMLQRELVVRSVDEKDRRRSSLILSSVGEEIYAEIIPLSRAYQDSLTECFTEQERKQFEQLLGKLYRHASDEKFDQKD